MGTGSLGGAVTDPQYHLMKVKGKDFWFVENMSQHSHSWNGENTQNLQKKKQKGIR